ncbi:MAG TPA: peptidylprolyl isomerase [Aquaticitalea sp.]|nr:peptidylprolyl isomerase [Aquaticitalea sp.]
MKLMTKTIQFFALFMLLTAAACQDKYPDLEDGLYAEIITNKGTMVLELEYEKAPITVANFVSLAEGTNTLVDSTYKGKKYYNGLTFHRIIDEFMIQGGDPTGTGSGSPGYKFNNEISEELKHDKVGTLSMANSGPNTNGSQFFITEKETPFLDGAYNVFGYLVVGEDVLHTLAGVETTKPGDKPVEPVVMQEVNIIRKGKDAKDFDAPKVFENHFAEAEKAEKERVAKMEEEKRIMEEKSAAAAVETKKLLDDYESKAKTLPSGLKVYMITKTDGASLKEGDNVKVNYEGYFKDGQLFDSNVKEVAEQYGKMDQRRADANGYAPMPMPIKSDAQMITGFKEAAKLLKVGEKAYFYLPSHLAYGERGYGPAIAPNTDLIFILEMVEITK